MNFSKEEAQKILAEEYGVYGPEPKSPEEARKMLAEEYGIKGPQAAANRARAAELERAPGWTDEEGALERANDALFTQGTAKVAKMAASETARTGDFLQAAATLPFSAAAKAAGLKKNWTTYMGAGDAIDQGIDNATNDYTKLSKYEEPLQHGVGLATGFGPAGLVGKGISKVGSKLLETGVRGTGLPGKYVSKVGEIAQEGAKVNAGNIGAALGSEVGGAIGGLPGAIVGGIAGAKAGPKAHGYFNEDVAKQNNYESALRAAKYLGIDPSVVDDAFKSGSKITLGQASDKEWVKRLENYASQSPTGSIPLAPIYEEQRGHALKKLGNVSENIENQDITGSNIISEGVNAKIAKESAEADRLKKIVSDAIEKEVSPSPFYTDLPINQRSNPIHEFNHPELVDASSFITKLNTLIKGKSHPDGAKGGIRDPDAINSFKSTPFGGFLSDIKDRVQNLKNDSLKHIEDPGKKDFLSGFLPNKMRHENLLDLRTQIGEAARNTFGLISKGEKNKLKGLYYQINNTLDEFYKGISPDAYKAWKSINKNYNVFASSKKNPLNKLLKLEKEDRKQNIFENVYSNLHQDTRALETIAETLKPQQATALHRQLMMRLGKDKHSEFSLVKFSKNYSQLPSHAQNQLIKLATAGMTPKKAHIYRVDFNKTIKSIKRNAKTLDFKDVSGADSQKMIRALTDAPAVGIGLLGTSLASLPATAAALTAKAATPYGIGKFVINQKRIKNMNEALGGMSAKNVREAKLPTGSIVRGLLKAAQNYTR